MIVSPVFRAIPNGLCLGRDRLFAMLCEFSSFADEFGPAEGLDPNKKFAGIASLLASCDKWQIFTEKWEELLNREKIPRPFSMKDFVQYKEKFKNERWKDPNERLRVLNLMLPIIQEAEVVPIGASVLLKDYWDLPEDCRSTLRSPYYIAFQEVTGNIGFAFTSLAMSKAESEDELFASGVSMTYARLRGFTGPAGELWGQIKHANMFGRWLRSYTPGDPIDHPPLQAADIWAYSLGRMGEHERAIKREAEIAFEFFANLAFKAAQIHGSRFFSLMDKQEILIRLGKFSELES